MRGKTVWEATHRIFTVETKTFIDAIHARKHTLPSLPRLRPQKNGNTSPVYEGITDYTITHCQAVVEVSVPTMYDKAVAKHGIGTQVQYQRWNRKCSNKRNIRKHVIKGR